ncbi:MAG: DUF1587 domain-containing protein, partial [Verrucomicrobiae bacterium]|nr:DUF1587 domain-containing protein [Verrucomicrobiae bacterium]
MIFPIVHQRWLIAALSGWNLISISEAAEPVTPAAFAEAVQPLLKEACLSCHSTEKQKGDLDLERFATLDAAKAEPGVWEKVYEQVESGEMPPKKERPLTELQKTALLAWVQDMLDEIALSRAGDPGPVVLRRLSNMEYTYTIRDLTGVETLDPAREFPVDGAAGEGFTNAGAALVMSPGLLTKYLDAAKEIAAHAVLTPEGIRFSSATSSRDWTNETLAEIRRFYARFTEATEQTVMVTGAGQLHNQGGVVPLAVYLDALQGRRGEQGLNAKYLSILRRAMEDPKPSLLLDPLRAKFREKALTVAEIEAWQRSLWRFTSVGHIGKENGPKAWQEAVNPLREEHEARLKLTAPADGGDLTLYLVTSDAGDGTEHDAAVWENPRLVAPGRPDLPVRQLPAILSALENRRKAVASSAAACLAAVHEADAAKERPDLKSLAAKHGVDLEILGGWLDWLGIGAAGEASTGSPLTQKLERTPDYDFIQGWKGEQALGVLANSSDA